MCYLPWIHCLNPNCHYIYPLTSADNPTLVPGTARLCGNDCSLDHMIKEVYKINGQIQWELCTDCTVRQAEGALAPLPDERSPQLFQENWERQRQQGSFPIPPPLPFVPHPALQVPQQAMQGVMSEGTTNWPQQDPWQMNVARSHAVAQQIQSFHDQQMAPQIDMEGIERTFFNAASKEEDLYNVTPGYERPDPFQSMAMDLSTSLSTQQDPLLPTSAPVVQPLNPQSAVPPAPAPQVDTHKFLLLDVDAIESQNVMYAHTDPDSDEASSSDPSGNVPNLPWQPVDLAFKAPSWFPSGAQVTRIDTGQHVPIGWLRSFKEADPRTDESEAKIQLMYQRGRGLEFNSSIREPLLFESEGQFLERQRRNRPGAEQRSLIREYQHWADRIEQRFLPGPEKGARKKRLAPPKGKGRAVHANNAEISGPTPSARLPLSEPNQPSVGSASSATAPAKAYKEAKLTKGRPSWLPPDVAVAVLPRGQYVPISWLRDAERVKRFHENERSLMYQQSLSLESNRALKMPLLCESFEQFCARFHGKNFGNEHKKFMQRIYNEWADSVDNNWLSPEEASLKQKRLLYKKEFDKAREISGRYALAKLRKETEEKIAQDRVRTELAQRQRATLAPQQPSISAFAPPQQGSSAQQSSMGPPPPPKPSSLDLLLKAPNAPQLPTPTEPQPIYTLASNLVDKPGWLPGDTLLQYLHTGQLFPAGWLHSLPSDRVGRYISSLQIGSNARLRQPLALETLGEYKLRQRGLNRFGVDYFFEAEYARWAADERTQMSWLPSSEKDKKIQADDRLDRSKEKAKESGKGK